MTTDRELGLDVSKWQSPYSDDGKDEGFKKPIIVIHKAADGKNSFYDENNWNKPTTEAMRKSLDGFDIVCMYSWIQTELGVEQQAQAIVRAYLAGDYDGIGFDYEAYMNVISKATAQLMQAIIERVKELLPGVVIMIYSNKWILNNLVLWLGLDWMNQHIIWAAGGSKYNQELTEQPNDSFHIYTIPGLRIDIEQFSADGNQAADEFDFGTSETASIDVNLINVPKQELLEIFGKADPVEPPEPVEPEDPECDCSEKIAEITKQVDEFILDVLAKVRKTALAMGEDTASLIEQDYEDLKQELQ